VDSIKELLIRFTVETVLTINNIIISGLEFLSIEGKTRGPDDVAATWLTLTTDIITIAVALGALALPISLTVIETTRTRYRSPTVLKIMPIISGVDVGALNKSLFLILAFSLSTKLAITLNFVDLSYMIPWICVLLAWFLKALWKVYKHLDFTYKIISDVGTIHKRLYKNIDSFFREILPPSDIVIRTILLKIRCRLTQDTRLTIKDSITAFIEIEAYLICTDEKRLGLDAGFTNICYTVLNEIPEKSSSEFIFNVLDSLPTLLAAVEKSREVDVYQSVAGLYGYLVARAILADLRFLSYLGDIERISRFREQELPIEGRFNRNGRLFMHIASYNMPSHGEDIYNRLKGHFVTLIDGAVREQPANVPQILKSIRSVVQFKGNYHDGGYVLAEKVNEIWGYPNLSLLDEDIVEAASGRLDIEAFEERMEAKYKPEMQAYLASEIQDSGVLEQQLDSLNGAIEECLQGITLKRFSMGIDVETLRGLAALLHSEPEIFIECRELRNPAGSNAYNVGHSPVPTSLSECIASFIFKRNFGSRVSRQPDLQEYEVVDAIGALIVYELWDIYVLRRTGNFLKPTIIVPTLPECLIGELADALSRIPFLKNAISKVLKNKRYLDRLGLLSTQTKDLNTYGIEFCREFEVRLEQAIRSKTANQPLDVSMVKAFTSKMVDDFIVYSSQYDLFKSVKVSVIQAPLVYHINIKRIAFLSGTNTHYILDSHAPDLIENLHYDLGSKILLDQSLALSSHSAAPSPGAELLYCTEEAIDNFIAAGFRLSMEGLVWPNERYVRRISLIRCEGAGFFPVFKNEALLKVNYVDQLSSIPIKIIESDDAEEVSFKIELYVAL
jgi:hypothetical protein